MKKSMIALCLLGMIAGTKIIAQQPVKQDLVKLAETVMVAPETVKEAYVKCQVNGEIDGQKMFGEFYERIGRVQKDIYSLTDHQNAIDERNAKSGEKALNDGFGDMSAKEQARYMKKNPALQNASGVNASMMELAAKMEDPAFRKKFDAMSDMEKAKLVQGYQQSQIQLSRKQHTQNGLNTVMEAGKIINQFNLDYLAKSLAADRENKVRALDQKERKALDSIQAEKTKLSRLIGKNTPDWVTRKYKELISQEWTVRTAALEKKLKLYRDNTLALVSSYKLAVKPFDDFLARENYGEELKAANEAKELAQLGGYQEGLLREIIAIQEVSRDITLTAANFYKEKMEAERLK